MHTLTTASCLARWDDVCTLDTTHRVPAHAPALPDGWARSWAVEVTGADGPARVPVSDLAAGAFDAALPSRTFTWRTAQRHRPGLQYMVSTGRQAGFESLEEQRFLLAADFDGRATEVLGQPFALRYREGKEWRKHTPDFLLRTAVGPWLVNVRPAGLVRDDDRRRFAAADAVAHELGWRHEVVTGWRQPAGSVVETMSAYRREQSDPLGMTGTLLGLLGLRGPTRFGELAALTQAPPVARAHILALAWRRRVSVDLGTPLGDGTVVALADEDPGPRA